MSAFCSALQNHLGTVHCSQRCGAAQHPPCFLYQDGKMSEQQHPKTFLASPIQSRFFAHADGCDFSFGDAGVVAGFPKATDEVGCCSWRLSVPGDPNARGRLLI